MNFSRYISNTLYRFLPVVAGALLWGCSADEFMTPDPSEQPDDDVQLRITLAIPQGESIDSQTRAVEGDGPVISPAQNAEDNELRIKDLRLYIFPETPEKNVSPAINIALRTPELSPTNDTETYFIKGLKGGSNYTLYLLGNFGDEARNLANEDALEKQVIDYTSNAHNLVPGNLPMVYKHPLTLQIPVNGSKSIDAVMKYACTKIRVNVIFDKSNPDSDCAKAFGSNFLAPERLILDNITKESKILWDKTTSFYETDSNVRDNALNLSYKFYTSWTKAASEPADGSDMISNVSGEITAAQAATASKWLLRATAYVPERYVANADNQTFIKLSSKVAGKDVEHGTPVGNDTPSSRKYLDLDRSTYYEYIGTVKNTNMQGADWALNIVRWEDVTIDADFVHTFLKLTDVKTKVTSFEDGIIRYETDGRGAVELDCSNIPEESGLIEPMVTAADGTKYPLFEIDPTAAVADGQKRLTIQVNSDVTIDMLNASTTPNEGKAGAWIVAGNIRKLIEIDYVLQPFIEFTPVEMKIQAGDGTTADQHIFTYRTNCGGFVMTSENITDWTIEDRSTVTQTHNPSIDGTNRSVITMKVRPGSTPSEGVVEIPSNNSETVKTTFTHQFVVTDKGGLCDPINVEVELMPKKDKYRVYFRAINDYHNSNDAAFGTVPAEQTTTGLTGTNWTDYWTGHKIYAYTQFGEAANSMPVWRYTADFGAASTEYEIDGTKYSFGSPDMTKDAGNPGWYYYDLPISVKGHYVKEGDQDATDEQHKKYGNGPLPGATLMIFYSSNDYGDIHRVNQHQEAGIPLGDYNDYESYVLFDPSRDPVYNVYDDKPIIVNTTYTIYSDSQMTDWRHDYGSNNIHGTLTNVSSQLTTAERNAGYSYKYNVTFKTPRGEYDKEIMLTVIESGGSTQTFTPPTYTGSAKRFYFGVPDTENAAWKNPTLGIKGGDTNVYYTYNFTYAGKFGNIDYYYVQFTQDYHVNDAKNNGAVITSGQNNWTHTANIDCTGTTKEIVVNVDSWNVHDLGYAVSNYTPPVTTSTTRMMNGYNWRTGYYKKSRTGNNKWTANP